jgi:hypothetical protein
MEATRRARRVFSQFDDIRRPDEIQCLLEVIASNDLVYIWKISMRGHACRMVEIKENFRNLNIF